MAQAEIAHLALTLAEADTLTGGDVLPGFSLPLRDFFAKPRRKR